MTAPGSAVNRSWTSTALAWKTSRGSRSIQGRALVRSDIIQETPTKQWTDLGRKPHTAGFHGQNPTNFTGKHIETCLDGSPGLAANF